MTEEGCCVTDEAVSTPPSRPFIAGMAAGQAARRPQSGSERSHILDGQKPFTSADLCCPSIRPSSVQLTSSVIFNPPQGWEF